MPLSCAMTRSCICVWGNHDRRQQFFPAPDQKRSDKKLEKVNLTGYVDNTSSIEAKLLNNELDLGIVEGIITSPNIVSEPIISDCLVLICGNAHSFAKMPVVHKEDLANQSFIMRELGSGTRSMFSFIYGDAAYSLSDQLGMP